MQKSKVAWQITFNNAKPSIQKRMFTDTTTDDKDRDAVTQKPQNWYD